MLSQEILSNIPDRARVAAALIFAAVTLLAASPGKERSESAFATQKQKGEAEARMPLAVYSAQLPADPVERAIRIARSGRFDKRYPVPFDELESTATARLEINDWASYMPPLPAIESDAIVLGEVTNNTGYLSNDRTGAYSEFSVRIDDVFKGNDRLSATSLTAVREGADVQLPSGRIIKYYIFDQGTPVTGRRYLFFLKHDVPGKDYTILTAYELRQNRVFPLDKVEPFIAYSNLEEGTFLNLVREAIANSKKIG